MLRKRKRRRAWPRRIGPLAGIVQQRPDCAPRQAVSRRVPSGLRPSHQRRGRPVGAPCPSGHRAVPPQMRTRARPHRCRTPAKQLPGRRSGAMSAAMRASALAIRRSSTAMRLRMSARASASAVCWSRFASCFRISTSWRRRTKAHAKFRKHTGIDTVGLADHIQRAGGVARPARVDPPERQRGRTERHAQEVIEAAARLEDDPGTFPGTCRRDALRRRQRVVDAACAAIRRRLTGPVKPVTHRGRGP